MVTTANLILLTVSIICFTAGETMQGCTLLAVMWAGSVLVRLRKEDKE